MNFQTTFTAVGTMLLYAIPGYIFVKSGKIKKEAISALAVVLMYLCQPCLTLSAFQGSTYEKGFEKTILFFFIFALLFMSLVLLISWLALRKKKNEARYRVACIANAFGNCGFLGIPLLAAVLPDHPESLLLASVYMAAMNIIGWSIGSAIIANDRKYISVKNIVLSPALLILFLAVPLYFTKTVLPGHISSMVSVLGKMTTPLCMLIMGMRLATMSIKSIFSDKLVYVCILIKQIGMPLLALLFLTFLPVEPYIKQTMFIICATPIASVVLNFAEMIGDGQETAANMVLLGTAMSVITIPVMALLV